jgi:hypothetical protein
LNDINILGFPFSREKSDAVVLIFRRENDNSKVSKRPLGVNRKIEKPGPESGHFLLAA